MISLSVIIPVRNGSPTIGRCLNAVLQERPLEIIVVNDGSTDDTARLLEDFPVTLLNFAQSGGPARARNLGARHATGDILVFIDADVEVHAGVLSAVAALFSSREEVQAVFGSYDDTPDHGSAVSRYKNLLHHYVHQHGSRTATTFWAGLGAVRRETYLRLGGLNEAYTRPSVEDIEFGFRLSEAGLLCELHPELLGKHLKRWTFAGLLRTDLMDRALPWTELMLRTRQFPTDLNLGWRHKAGAALAVPMLATPFVADWHTALPVILLLIGAFFLAHLPFFRFLGSRGGPRLIIGAIPLHLLYSLCCAVGLGMGFGLHMVRLILGRQQVFSPMRREQHRPHP